MEDSEKVSLSQTEEQVKALKIGSSSENIIKLLRRFLAVQQRRALAYARLKREITVEFNDCSKQVLELESLFASPDSCREDLAHLFRSVQAQEKEKLNLTATIQVLKKAGRPSERLVSHDNCRFRHSTGHECLHIQQITEASGTEEAEADAQYENALKEAIKGVQDTILAINQHLEEVRYEIEALEAE
ncbi:Unknown protein [Striga hermonthica]|uniref:Uncharacterized protein n=1 Tax=Striga hermonthica TaxID=68872 RepID=A0A9N7RHZ3_STRHE|nr:Unknown protein [Striga hermonthica]